MDAIIYTTDRQEYEILSGILEEESLGLTVSRGVMDGEYHFEREYDVAVVGINGAQGINLGRENAGCTASLYYYNESTGELEFICSDEVAEDGAAALAYTHASDYVIAIDGEEERGSAAEPAQPENQDGDSTIPAGENPQAVQAWWLIVAGALVIVVGIGAFFVLKKKRENSL